MTKFRTAEAPHKRSKEIDMSNDEESKNNGEKYFAIL
jgi:hypothetical protein